MDVREKLVELILNADNDKNLVSYDLYELTHERTGCAEYFADYLIANGVTVQEWISVDDRLPEDDLPQDTDRKQIRCLVATDKGTVKPCVRQRYQKKIDGQWQLCEWEWNKDLFAKPTHWMLMPQPPKGE